MMWGGLGGLLNLETSVYYTRRREMASFMPFHGVGEGCSIAPVLTTSKPLSLFVQYNK